MPNRILKESICTSENIEQLSMIAEIAFYRLIVNCDDFGRMDARPKILKARLFPLKDIDETDIISAMKSLEQADLITLYLVDNKPYLQMKTWEHHQQVRNHKSKYPSPADADCVHLQSNDINCNQLQSNVPVIQSNPIQSLSESESLSLSESLIDDEIAKDIQRDQNTVLNAAEDAGFKMSNDVRSALIKLYAEHGLEKILEGLRSCSEHGATNLAYLRACLSGTKKKEKARVPAQDFPQRDYGGVQDEMMDSLAKEIEAMRASEVG